MTTIEKQNQEIVRHAKGLERKCEMLERDNKDLEYKYNTVIKELSLVYMKYIQMMTEQSEQKMAT